MVRYMAANSKTKCLSRKFTGVSFIVNYSIHLHALALDVIQVPDSNNYF